MVAVQNTLAQLQTQIANVNANVLQGTVSNLAADAQPTVTAIKTDGEDVNALIGALYQLVCPQTGCTKMRLKSPGNVTAAFNALCYPNGTLNSTLATQCNNVSQAEYNTLLDVKGAKPKQAVSNLAEYALGSAGVGGPTKAGIVQYVLQSGAPSDGFFQTQNAANARLEWGYYTLASIWAQTTFAEAAGMGIGQPEPGTNQKHPPILTATVAKNGVNKLNGTIDAFMGAFPNIPDTAVIDTNTNASDGDPPYMWAQDIGGLNNWDAFTQFASMSWDLNNNGGLSGSTGTNGMAGNRANNFAQAPIAMTPAAANGQTWVMLPATGKGTVPSMTSARFTDWKTGQGTINGSNSSQLNGPLGDLYNQAPGFSSSASQTRGQWMTSNSGINPQLLTVTGLGYNAANQNDQTTWAGMFFYYLCTQTDCNKNQALYLGLCPPAGDTSCLLPTYYDAAQTPYTGQEASSGTPTGFFDYNQGQLITNQQGHSTGAGTPFPNGGTFNTNTSQWVNQWVNWSQQALCNTGQCYGGVVIGIDTAAFPLSQYPGAFSPQGRPVLFDRTQVSNSSANSDCFYWNGATSSPADGTGCLAKRTTTSQILPAIPSNY
jgi:hypothetical protein